MAAKILEEHTRVVTAKIPKTALTGAAAWSGRSLRPDDGFIKLSAAARQELDDVVGALRSNPLSCELLTPGDFDLSECRAMMAQAERTLSEGVGFVIIDRLPMDQYSKEEAKAVYWLLAQMVGRPVAQNWAGKVIYDVTDLGKPPGNGVRPDVTNAEQNFHTDNSYNVCAPDYVALLCLRTAKEGGVSSIVSFHSVYNAMLERHPQLVDRLFSPYLFDRQKEHSSDDPPVISHPLMQIENGELVCRLSYRHVINGHRMAEIEMDAGARDALEALEATMKDDCFVREFVFEPGQIQIVDNKRLGHRRTGYTDHAEADKKRHLVRLWLRNEGRRFYNG